MNGCNNGMKISEKPYNFNSFEIEKKSHKNGKEKVIYCLNDANEVMKIFTLLTNYSDNSKGLEMCFCGNMPKVIFKNTKTGEQIRVNIEFNNYQISIYHKKNEILWTKNKEFVTKYLNIMKNNCKKEYKHWNDFSKSLGASGIDDYLANGVKK